MGYGALIGGIISAVGSTASGLLSKGGGGGNLGEYSSTLNKLAQRYITPFADNQSFWDLNLPNLANIGLQYGMDAAPNLNTFNMAQLKNLLGQALPGYQDMISQMTTNTNQLLQGQVPADVQQQIQRGAAYTNLISGVGGGGAGAEMTTKSITARDLGLTSLDLTQRGQAQGTNLLQLARNYLMPQPTDPTKLLPLSDLMAGEEYTKNAIYTANYNAYAAEAASAAARVGAPPPSAAAGIAGGFSALNTFLQQKNPDTGQSGYGMLGQLFGGGGGQTGSGVADQFVAGMGLGGAGGAANFGY